MMMMMRDVTWLLLRPHPTRGHLKAIQGHSSQNHDNTGTKRVSEYRQWVQCRKFLDDVGTMTLVYN